MIRRLSPVPLVVALAMLTGCSEPDAAPTFDAATVVVAIGDSIMVDAEGHLTGLVEGIVIDAEVGRPFRDGIAAVESQVSSAGLPDVLVVGLGTNGGTNAGQIESIIEEADGAARILFVNVRVPRDWEPATNAALAEAAAHYPIVDIVDWYGESVESDELFRADGYHPNAVGSERWANLIVAKIKGPGE